VTATPRPQPGTAAARHPPELDPTQLAALAQAAVARIDLDLSGAVVLTEAATGAYAVTAALAALAGADHVYARCRASRHGTIEAAWAETIQLARLAGVAARLQLLTESTAAVTARVDIVTNSGHVRPIDEQLVGWMKPTAVVSLMYEAWEHRPTDIDLAACERRGIAVAGTNERHPAIDTFAVLGDMAIELLSDARVGVRGARVLLLCDNPFAEFIADGLVNAGARVDIVPALPEASARSSYEVVLVALQPGPEPFGAEPARTIAASWPGALVAQFWGDVDREAFARAGIRVWPRAAPEPGHMGVLPSAVGPEPLVRLQAGGLKVGEILWLERWAGRSVADSLAAAVSGGYGTTP